MKKYIGVKIVEAGPMSLGAYNMYRGWDIPKDEDPAKRGYIVKYPDGYESWCPEKQFEEANRPCDAMTSGHAIEAMKKGSKVARAGWNGKGMFLSLQVPDENSKMTFPYPYLTIPDCEEGTRRIPYASTIVDLMAEDWTIIE